MAGIGVNRYQQALAYYWTTSTWREAEQAQRDIDRYKPRGKVLVRVQMHVQDNDALCQVWEVLDRDSVVLDRYLSHARAVDIASQHAWLSA